jgi:hypothetical protein
LIILFCKMFRGPISKIANGASRRLMHSKVKDNDVVVVSFARTPLGKIGGSLSTLKAPQVGYIRYILLDRMLTLYLMQCALTPPPLVGILTYKLTYMLSLSLSLLARQPCH